MRKINFTVEIDDNDYVEYALINELKSSLVEEKIKHYKVIPNTKELYDNDPIFRKLSKTLKDCKEIHANYINQNNH